MRIGIMIGSDGDRLTMEQLETRARSIEQAGLDDIWLANIFSFDAITTLAILGRAAPGLGLGTAVTPTYPRHPTAIAQQALTTAAATDNRFTLGIGLSHKVVIEDMLGFSYHKPARHMREYLAVLLPLLAGETTNFDGDQYRVHGLTLDVPGAERVPVVIAGLGPVMLRLAGEVADGTNTWMVGPNTMEKHIVAGLTRAASNAGRPQPKVVGGFPIVLTNNVEAARASIAESLTIYGQLPSYRAMLDREGVAGPADIAMIGDEQTLRAGLARLRDLGVSHFNGAIANVEPGAYERTLEFLGSALD